MLLFVAWWCSSSSSLLLFLLLRLSSSVLFFLAFLLWDSLRQNYRTCVAVPAEVCHLHASWKPFLSQIASHDMHVPKWSFSPGVLFHILLGYALLPFQRSYDSLTNRLPRGGLQRVLAMTPGCGYNGCCGILLHRCRLAPLEYVWFCWWCQRLAGGSGQKKPYRFIGQILSFDLYSRYFPTWNFLARHSVVLCNIDCMICAIRWAFLLEKWNM